MKTTCEKCGDPLSTKRLKEMQVTAEFSEPRPICDECFDFESSAYGAPDYEQFSDADPGL